jgi:hypothetical protein
MCADQNIDVTVSKSELDTLALAAYQAALNDAVSYGMVSLRQKDTLHKVAMEKSIVFEATAFYDRKRRTATEE